MVVKSNFIPLIRADQVKTYLDYIKQFERPILATLSETGLPEDIDSVETDDYISREVVLRLFRIVSTQLPETSLIKMIAVCSRSNALKLTQGKRLEGTVRDSLIQLCDQLRIDSTDSNFVLESKLGQMWFHRKRANESLPEGELSLILTIVNVIQLFVGQNWTPKEITLQGAKSSLFEHAFPQHNILYQKQKQFTGLYIPPSVLATEIAKPTQDAHIADFHELNTFKFSLKRLLEPYISGSTPTLTDAAHYTNMSVRTLQRRLASEGFSFTDIIFELLDEIACDALINSDESIADISFRLGYSSPSHLIRAFKKKFEVTPNQFREKYTPQRN
ncbi:Transcriptional regulator [Vibrio crassostreae]|nr:Transcriptional regulator [Vibrio crassostreae]CAK3041322.1 Transcriptional regulator [Vibrio crassostreae]CAK3041655.1 Transcriptional regulator [Vibrio crassostreae]CAK3043911.1 Transcriptional regulator [Vibrio crassostreae]CAK3044011.1 Transcriptional regulator [Vibrio crassostreae]